MTRIDSDSDVKIEIDPALQRQATDIVCGWLTFLDKQTGSYEPLVRPFEINNPDKPEQTKLHDALVALLGIGTPQPLDSPMACQDREEIYSDKRGRIVRQIMYLGADAERPLVTSSGTVEGLPAGTFVVNYSVEKTIILKP